MNQKIFFYGTECPHCEVMRPLIARLVFDTGIILDERDVWVNQTDYRLYENYQNTVMKKDPECEGLPFFYDTKSQAYLCGKVSYKDLHAWAVIE
jgi:thiol-disulfide isomerase/thioredoxin